MDNFARPALELAIPRTGGEQRPIPNTPEPGAGYGLTLDNSARLPSSVRRSLVLRVSAAEFALLIPSEGDEVYLNADPAAGVLWHLRYNATILDAYKWQFMGGPPMAHDVDAVESRNATTYGDCTTVGPVLTPPRQGVYDLQYGMNGSINSATNNAQYMSPKFSAAEAVDADAATIPENNHADAANHTQTATRARRVTVDVTGQIVTMRYKQGTANATSPVSRRWLRLTPVRVRHDA